MFIGLNGGLQASDFSFADTRTEPRFGESASWTADYAVKSGPAFDIGGGVRVWRNLLAQVSYAQFTDSRVAAVAGEVPHPFFFSQPRAITGESTPLKQQDRTVHIAAVWSFPVARHFDISVFGGPSLYTVRRDLVADVIHADVYPFDAATFSRATVERVSKSGPGFNAGADVTWLFTRSLGIGGIVRFTRARVTLDSPANTGTVPLDLGGLQVGGGLRLRLGNTASKRVVPPSSNGALMAGRPGGTPASGAAANRRRNTTVIKVAAPVYIAPDATRAALRLLPAGTRVKVREESGDWLMVEFSDPQWGDRVGYVLKKNCDW